METKELKKEEVQDVKKEMTLKEKRIVELKEKLEKNVEARELDEYVSLYISLVLGHASTLRIKFDNLKE